MGGSLRHPAHSAPVSPCVKPSPFSQAQGHPSFWVPKAPLPTAAGAPIPLGCSDFLILCPILLPECELSFLRTKTMFYTIKHTDVSLTSDSVIHTHHSTHPSYLQTRLPFPRGQGLNLISFTSPSDLEHKTERTYREYLLRIYLE